jgi:hypothetical protein
MDAVVTSPVPFDIEPAIFGVADAVGKPNPENLRVSEIGKPSSVNEAVQTNEGRPDFVHRANVKRSEISIQVLVG